MPGSCQELTILFINIPKLKIFEYLQLCLYCIGNDVFNSQTSIHDCSEEASFYTMSGESQRNNGEEISYQTYLHIRYEWTECKKPLWA